MTLKTRVTVLFTAAIIIPVSLVFFKLLWIASVTPETGEGSSAFFQYINMFKFELLALLLLVLLLGALFLYIHKVVLTPLLIIQESIREARKGNVSPKLGTLNKGEIGEIAHAITDMALDLNKAYKEIELQSEELIKKNWKIREANLKLEALCGQVEVIMEELRETEARYRSLEAKLPEIMCVTDRFGVICAIDQLCVELTGYERADLIGLNIASLVDTGGCEFSIDSVLKSLKEKEMEKRRLTLVKKEGGVVHSEVQFRSYISNGIEVGLQVLIKGIGGESGDGDKHMFRNNDLFILNSLNKSLCADGDLENLCKVIVNEINKKLGFPICMIGLLDSSGMGLRIKAFSSAYLEETLSSLNINLNSYLSERAVISSESLDENEVLDNWLIGNINRNRPAAERIKELLYVPIRLKNKNLGVLVIGLNSQIMPEEISLINSIATNAAVAIDNALLYETCKRYFVKSVNALIATIEAKDVYTKGHSQRVSRYTVHIAEKLNLSKEQVEDVRLAGMLHDIGKIGINDNILLKPGRLTKSEYEEVKRHPAVSNRILHHIGISDRALKAIAYHHERFDGKGYPYGISGNSITLEAQIIAVADAYDAMTSNRPYRKAMSVDEAIDELKAHRSSQFSPEVVDALIGVRDGLKSELMSA